MLSPGGDRSFPWASLSCPPEQRPPARAAAPAAGDCGPLALLQWLYLLHIIMRLETPGRSSSDGLLRASAGAGLLPGIVACPSLLTLLTLLTLLGCVQSADALPLGPEPWPRQQRRPHQGTRVSWLLRAALRPLGSSADPVSTRGTWLTLGNPCSMISIFLKWPFFLSPNPLRPCSALRFPSLVPGDTFQIELVWLKLERAAEAPGGRAGQWGRQEQGGGRLLASPGVARSLGISFHCFLLLNNPGGFLFLL